MAETNVINLTGDYDDVRIVSNKAVTRDVETIYQNDSEVCFGLMEKMYVTDHPLPTPALLGWG